MSDPNALAAAAMEAYRLAKGMCGKHNAHRRADCDPYLVRGMTCVDCPMETVGPIEDVLSGRSGIPDFMEWHGLDAEKAELPSAIDDRIAGWHHVLCVGRIVVSTAANIPGQTWTLVLVVYAAPNPIRPVSVPSGADRLTERVQVQDHPGRNLALPPQQQPHHFHVYAHLHTGLTYPSLPGCPSDRLIPPAL